MICFSWAKRQWSPCPNNFLPDPAVEGATTPNRFNDSIGQHFLEDPQQVIAIWLLIDGDDTRSSYTTTIKSLLLKGLFDA